jgi:hypothetical protein
VTKEPTPTKGRTAPARGNTAAFDQRMAAVNQNDRERGGSRSGGGYASMPAEVADLMRRTAEEAGVRSPVDMTPAQIVEAQRQARLDAFQRREDEDHERDDARTNDEQAGGDESSDRRDRRARTDANRDPELRRARESLRRTGMFTEDELDSMPRDLALAKARKADRQRARSAARSDRTQQNQSRGRHATSSRQGDAPQSHRPASNLNAEELAKSLVAGLNSADPEAAAKQVIEKLLNNNRPQPASRHENDADDNLDNEEVDDDRNARRRTRELPDDEQVEDLRFEYAESYPDLEDDDTYEEVLAVMESLPSNAFPRGRGRTRRESLAARMEAAVRAVGLEPVGGRVDPERTLRRNGRLSVPRGNQRVNRAPSDPKERARIKFEHLRQHPGDLVGAKRAAGES